MIFGSKNVTAWGNGILEFALQGEEYGDLGRHMDVPNPDNPA